MQLFSRLNTAILSFTNKEISVTAILLSLHFIIFIRMFLEEILGHGHRFFQPWDSYSDLCFFLHIYASWICIFLSMTIVVRLFLCSNYKKSLMFTLLFYPIIITPPVIDFVVTGGVGANVQYARSFDDFFRYLLNMINPFVNLEIVPVGVRVEIATVTIGSFFVSKFVFRQGIWRSMLLCISIYLTIFFYFYLPLIMQKIGFISQKSAWIISVTEVTLTQASSFMYVYVFVALCIIIWALVYKERKDFAKALFSLIFPSRSIYYIFLLIFGFFFSAKVGSIFDKVFNPVDMGKLITATLSIFTVFINAKVINDIYDLPIDRISNNDRPLVKGIFTIDDAKVISNIALVISLTTAMMSSKSFLACWFFLYSLASIYSMPPFRLRRFYPLGHLVLSLFGTGVFLSGAMLALGDNTYNKIEPKSIFLYVFASYFCLCHIKDFKDIQGDRLNGISNIMANPYRKVFGIMSLWGYCLFVWLITGILSLDVWLFLLSYGIVGSIYIIKVKDLSKIDRLIPISLIMMILFSTIWLYKQWA